MSDNWELYYWPLSGRGEYVRIIFEELGIPFKDVTDAKVIMENVKQPGPLFSTYPTFAPPMLKNGNVMILCSVSAFLCFCFQLWSYLLFVNYGNWIGLSLSLSLSLSFSLSLSLSSHSISSPFFLSFLHFLFLYVCMYVNLLLGFESPLALYVYSYRVTHPLKLTFHWLAEWPLLTYLHSLGNIQVCKGWAYRITT